MSSSTPVVSSGKVSAFRIPTDLPESDGTAEWDATTIVIVELTAGGVTSLGYAYTDEAAAQVCKEFIQKEVIGKDPGAVPELAVALGQFARNRGKPGLVSSAIAAIDASLWDLKARLLQIPLLTLLGKMRDEVSAYGSGGFTSYTDKQLVQQLTGWAEQGLRSVKMKIGRDPEQDLQRVALVQKALKGRAELFVDANGAYSRKQALYQGQRFAELGCTWFEEPVSSDDLVSLNLLVERMPTPLRIAAGEYIYVLDDAKNLINARAVDVLQTDVTRCGGPSNFLKIGHTCEMFHLPFSAHTSPSLHATLCCALPAAINVEYFHDHERIEGMIFDGAIRAVNGYLRPDLTRHGFGLELKRADAEKFQVSHHVVV
jgi:L-alanine-DL-glutamate epimerase-like enolase superfamily enzyme